jgi:hypothetical protein
MSAVDGSALEVHQGASSRDADKADIAEWRGELGSHRVGWLALQLGCDLIFILMPDHKRRDVVEFRDGF